MNIARRVCYLLTVGRLLWGGTLGHRPVGNKLTSVPLTGLDCRKPVGVTYSYLQDVCEVREPLSEPRLEDILILQEVMVRETKGAKGGPLHLPCIVELIPT